MKLNKLLKITLGMALTTFMASAEPFNVDGLYYEVLSSNEVAVVASPDGIYQSINDVNIPDKVGAIKAKPAKAEVDPEPQAEPEQKQDSRVF